MKLFRPYLSCVLMTFLAALPLASGSAHAQTAVEKLSTKQSNQAELEKVARKLKEARARQKALLVEIAGYDKDIGAINRALIAAAKSGRELESQVSRAESNLLAVTKTQSILRRSLSSKRSLMAEVLGALQRMGSKPPPALLVSPEDALASVRSAILLGAVVPEIRTQTATLLSELKALAATSRKVEENKAVLADRLNALVQDEARLTLLLDEKRELTQGSREELQKEKQLAASLAAKATSLEELIGSLEGQIASAAAAAKAAREADERRAKEEAERLAKAKEQLQSGETKKVILADQDPTRIEPAIPFAKARGKLIVPVSGQTLYGFGAKTRNPRSAASDGSSRNLAIATRPNARVAAPADGWVVYAGPFRSFGQLLILNAGGGYHMVLAGLAETNVETGRFVLAGEPIGRMGVGRDSAARAANFGSNRPVLYVELRQDGKSIDPAPWWAPDTRLSASAGDG